MRAIAAGLVILALLLGDPRRSIAACGDDDPDGSRVAAARSLAENECPCFADAPHPDYVRCIARVVRRLVTAGTLPESCKGAVRRCAVRSVCRRPNAVTCCIAQNGTTGCRIARSGATCSRRHGVASAFASCCDACATSGSTTTTTTLPSRGPCGGIAGVPCNAGEFCELPTGHCCCDFQGSCVPVPAPCVCGQVFAPVCGCDGMTYGNDCERRCTAVSKAHDGACGGTGVSRRSSGR